MSSERYAGAWELRRGRQVASATTGGGSAPPSRTNPVLRSALRTEPTRAQWQTRRTRARRRAGRTRASDGEPIEPERPRTARRTQRRQTPNEPERGACQANPAHGSQARPSMAHTERTEETSCFQWLRFWGMGGADLQGGPEPAGCAARPTMAEKPTEGERVSRSGVEAAQRRSRPGPRRPLGCGRGRRTPRRPRPAGADHALYTFRELT
jgi:hypothetical protein